MRHGRAARESIGPQEGPCGTGGPRESRSARTSRGSGPAAQVGRREGAIGTVLSRGRGWWHKSEPRRSGGEETSQDLGNPNPRALIPC